MRSLGLSVALGLTLALGACSSKQAREGEGSGAESKRARRAARDVASAEKPAVAHVVVPPPPTRREDVVDELHGVEVPDPYRWLENIDDPAVKEWLDAQDAFARRGLSALPDRAAIHARLSELAIVDRVGAPRIEGDRRFFSKLPASKDKWIRYVQDGEDGEPRVLIDANTLSEDGSISIKGGWPSPDGKRYAYKRSVNAADNGALRIRDVDSGEDLPDVIEGARYASPSWTPDAQGFYYTALPNDPSIPAPEMPGHASVKFHRLGTDSKDDPEVHPALGDPKTFIGSSLSRDGRWLVLQVSRGFDSHDVWIQDLQGKEGPATKAGFVPVVVGQPHHYQVQVVDGRMYIETDEGAPMGRVMSADPTKPQREHWTELVPEGESALVSVQLRGGHLVLRYLDKAHSRIRIHDLQGKHVRDQALPGLGTAGGLVGRADLDEAYYGFASYSRPRTTYRTSLATGETTVWHEPKVPVKGDDFVTEQHFATSKDGTKISFFLVRAKTEKADGARPVLLTGYGGFNASRTPGFSSTAITWLERGGIYVGTNLRGGGEYGESWHEAGKGPHKQNTFDDFLAVARWLVDEGWTAKGKIAIMGGSNGGLLVGAAATQAPDLFGAVLCSVPLLDMIRYHRFGAGPTWISEYGSADDAQQFATLWKYSPYHRIEAQRLPPTLMLSADSDDRVDPMHARKFTAAAQATGTEVWLRVEKNAGHGGADRVRAGVERSADQLAFAWSRVAG